MKHEIKWLEFPEDHDYPAALSYLTLHFNEEIATSLVDRLRAAEMSEFKAKDVIRASGLRQLGEDNRHVAHNLKKIRDGNALSPILLVRMDGRLLIADGYHRTSAVYCMDEDAVIPAKIV